ncbi:MAG: outer membrane beta-barrel protein [Spartobacteria bacterium]
MSSAEVDTAQQFYGTIEPVALGQAEFGLANFFGPSSEERRGSVRNSEEIASGWTVGAGGDWAFNNEFSIGMEYRHNDFGDVGFGSHHKGIVFANGSHVDLESDQVNVRVNILLGTLFRRH